MPKERQKECPNCKGTNKKCHYLTDAKICTKGKSKGKAKGKAIGKAISQKTLDKRELYDELLGDYHTDYLNEMRNRQLRYSVDKKTGEITKIEQTGRTTSFERYLSLIGQKNLASYYRRHFKDDLDNFNFKDL